MTPEFKKRLGAAVRVVLREMRDGCPDCMEQPLDGFCLKHYKEAIDIADSPRHCQAIQKLLGKGEVG